MPSLFPQTTPPPDQEAPRHKELDRLLKSVMAIDQGRVLQWICSPAFCRLAGLPQAPPRLLAQLDKEFSDIKRAGDYLLHLAFALLELAVHFEFQRRPDPHMGERTHRYQGGARTKHGLDVLSVVLHMLSFLLEIRLGGDGSRHVEVVDEVLTMLQLEDSWIYQRAAQKGYDKGTREGYDKGAREKLKEAALEVLRRRFGADAAAEEEIGRMSDPDQLSQLLVRLATAGTLAEALAG